MREAGVICTNTMLQALNKIAPGVPQYEIIGDIYKNQLMEWTENTVIIQGFVRLFR